MRNSGHWRDPVSSDQTEVDFPRVRLGSGADGVEPGLEVLQVLRRARRALGEIVGDPALLALARELGVFQVLPPERVLAEPRPGRQSAPGRRKR